MSNIFIPIEGGFYAYAKSVEYLPDGYATVTTDLGVATGRLLVGNEAMRFVDEATKYIGATPGLEFKSRTGVL